MTKSTDELKERLKKSCGWCGRYPACGAATGHGRHDDAQHPAEAPRCEPAGAAAEGQPARSVPATAVSA